MLLRFVLATVVLGIWACAGGGEGEVQRPPDSPYRDAKNGVALHVPAGWSARDTTYLLKSHEDVFLTVANPAAGLVVLHDSSRARSDGIITVGCDATVMREQLPKRAVILLYSHFVGGFPPGSWYVDDTVGASLAGLLDTLKTTWQLREGIWSYHVSFLKWGVSWLISAHSNGEPSKADRQAVEEILRSTTFPPLPIAYRQQAIELAYSQLPRDAQNSGLPSVPGDREIEPCREGGQEIMGGGGRGVYRVTFGAGDRFRRTEVSRQDGLFIVTFQIGEHSAQHPPQIWSYSVSPRGAVSLLQNR